MNGQKVHLSGSKLIFDMNSAVFTLGRRYFPTFIESTIYNSISEFFIYSTLSVRDSLTFLKSSTFFQMQQLSDLWASDYPSDAKRFQLNYYLLSIRYSFRLALRHAVGYKDTVQTVTDIFPSAGWLEREIWDLYGVFFNNHPDLRRILTDYGFEGHPLRKDFPLSGYTQLRYDDEVKQIVSEPVSFSQEYRYFDFLSPWRNS